MANKKQENIEFEAAMKRIDEITALLEDSSIKLDASLELYEEGITLVSLCKKKLDEAQRRIVCLTPNEDGEIVENDFTPQIEGEI